MMKFTKLLKCLVFINLILLLTNCSTDQNNEYEASSSTEEAKIWYENHKKEFSAPVLNLIENLEWNNAITSEGSQGEVIEVPFTLENNLSASNKVATLYNDHNRLMFIKTGNGFKLYHIQIFTDHKDSTIRDKDFNFYNIQKDFSGKIYLQDLSTGVAQKLEFRNGVKILQSDTSKTTTYDAEAIECVWYGYWYEDGHFEPIELVYCSLGDDPIEYPNPNYGGGGSGSGGTGSTSGTAPIKITSEVQFHELVESTDGTGYDITVAKQLTSTTSTVKMRLVPWLSVQYIVKSVKVGSKYEVNEVTSSLSGVWVGNTWNQNSFSVTPDTATNTTFVGVIGSYGAGIEVNGVTIGVNETINYVIAIDNATGRIKWSNRL